MPAKTIDRDRDEAIARALDIAKAGGGGFHIGAHRAPGIRIAKPVKMHVGAIHSSVAGRTDHLPMHVPSGSYVIPADVVSGHGEGNSMAGFKVMHRVFGGTPYGAGASPYGVSGGPYGAPMKAAGGETNSVPIVAAGGEYVVDPDGVRRVGEGDMEMGHRVLDEFVERSRSKLVSTLKTLPGPQKD